MKETLFSLHFILPPSSLPLRPPSRSGFRFGSQSAADHSPGGAGGLQSHQPCVKQTPQSVQTHTPQTSVPLQVLVQHSAAGAASSSDGSLFSASRTCTLNDRP